jgi:PilZ domain
MTDETAKPATEDSRRSEFRRRVIKGGKIVYNKRQTVIDCSIRDLTPGGAKLITQSAQSLPRNFQLEFMDGNVRSCELRWGQGTVFGVKFLDP